MLSPAQEEGRGAAPAGTSPSAGVQVAAEASEESSAVGSMDSAAAVADMTQGAFLPVVQLFEGMGM